MSKPTHQGVCHLCVIDLYFPLPVLLHSENILLIEKNEGFSYIEFDTNSQSDKSKKLLCLIEINNINDNNNPYIISLKKYYHFGRFLTVKLIDQNSMYGTINLNCIDFGTINFYGEVYEIN